MRLYKAVPRMCKSSTFAIISSFPQCPFELSKCGHIKYKWHQNVRVQGPRDPSTKAICTGFGKLAVRLEKGRQARRWPSSDFPPHPRSRRQAGGLPARRSRLREPRLQAGESFLQTAAAESSAEKWLKRAQAFWSTSNPA